MADLGVRGVCDFGTAKRGVRIGGTRTDIPRDGHVWSVMADERLKAWIRQARADLDAGRRDGRFRQHFLHRHSPLKQLSQEVAADAGLPKSLRLLLRQLDAELGELDGEWLLRKVDSTTPTTDPTDASYRYPFRGPAGEEVAPVDWSRADWDRYQGNSVGVAAAIDRFLRTVENRRQRGRAMT